MGRNKSKRSRSEGPTASMGASEAPEVTEEVAAEAEVPVVVEVEVGGDAKALANMFALSGSVFGKKASYARAGEAPAPEKKEKKEQKEQKEVAPKLGKKKEKIRKQKLLQEKEAALAAAKADAEKEKKDKKKDKKQQAEEVVEEEEEEKAAEQGDGRKKKQKNRKLKQKEKKKADATPIAETNEDAAESEPEADNEEKEEEVETAIEKEKEPTATDKPVDEAKSRRTVFVGNVSLDATEKDVARHFAPCGKVEAVRLRNMPVAGCAVGQAGNQKLMMKVCANKKLFNDKRETCNAYVVFASEESVAAALALDGSTLLSKKLKVDRETLVVDPRRSVFVGNIAFQLPDDQLRAFFSARLRSDDEPEPVESVRIVRDRESGLGKGFGYVLLKTSSLAAKALSLHETKLGTREIRVQVCGKRTKNRRGEEADPAKKHEGLRAAAGARARILLKRKSSSQGEEAAEAKRQKFAGTVKTIKPKHAARKARQAAEAAGAAGAAGSGAGDKKSSKRPRGDDKQGGGRNSKAETRPGKKSKVQKIKAQTPKVQKVKAKAQKPKHAARKARQAAEAAAKA